MPPRPTKEWIGKRPESAAPPKVRQRVRDRDGSICRLCSTIIKPAESFELDHIVALINGGENKETNLSAVHKHCHLAKTRIDVAEKKKTAAMRQKFTGARRPAGKLRGPGFAQSEKAAKRQAKESLPPRMLYRSAFVPRGGMYMAGTETDGE
jgi:5-methylcytosine-specific restriction enzyme A